MFRKNNQHLQWPLFGGVDSLPKKQQERLGKSWADTFYREFFCRIDEEPFAIVYSDEDSRPNIPVNVLVGFETLKAGFGWSDEEAYDRFCFDVQVRYALGYRGLISICGILLSHMTASSLGGVHAQHPQPTPGGSNPVSGRRYCGG